jgi:flagellar motor component MotA
MLNKIGLLFALVSLLTGAILVNDGVSRSDSSQSLMVICGAFLFALGLVTFSLVARDWWDEREHFKEARRSVPTAPLQE